MSNNVRDIFNTDVNFICTGTGTMYPAYNGTNTQFNQNIIVSNTSTGGIRIGANVGTSSLADGKIVSIGSDGFCQAEVYSSAVLLLPEQLQNPYH